METRPWDAVIVGGGYAGAATAASLARRGLRVLLLEKSRAATDVQALHAFGPSATIRLAQLDLLDAIEAAGAPPLTQLRLSAPDEGLSVTGRFEPVLGIRAGYCLHRSVLIDLLVDAARAAGAEVRENTEVTDLLWADSQVGGVVAVERRGVNEGLQYKEAARVVVGADGRHSRITRWVNAGAYVSAPAAAPMYAAGFRGAAGPHDTIEMIHTGRRDYLLFPAADDLTSVLVALPREELGRYRADHEHNFQQDINAVTELADRFCTAERVSPVRGATDLESHLRVPAGPGWALAGDAGAHIHPLSPRGVDLALRDAELLSAALAEALGGGRDPGEALAEYHRLRDLAARPAYNDALAVAALTGRPLPTSLAELWRALTADQVTADWWVSRQPEPRSPEAAAQALEAARVLTDQP